MANDITGRIKLDMKNAAKDLETIEKASVGAGEAVEGIGTKGQVVSRVLGQVADNVEQDLADAKRAADALSASLGPEMTERLGTAGVDDLVAKLRNMGLTADDIEMEVDELAAAIKRLDDVGASIDGTRNRLNNVSDAQKRVTDGANMNRSVIANFAGNAAQELPLVTSAFGPLNMAISQAVEYGAEGNINLKAMLSAGLGMAAVAGVMQGVSAYMQDIADTKAFEAKEVKTFKDALSDTEGVVEGLLQSARELEKIEFNADKFTVPGGAGFMKEVQDIIPLMAKARITGEDWFEAMNSGAEGWGDMIRRIGSSARLTEDEMDTLTEAFLAGYGKVVEATDRAAQEQFVLGEAAESAASQIADSIDDAKARYDRFGSDGVENMGDVEEAADDVVESVEDIRDELAGLRADIANDQSAIDLAAQFDQFRQSAVDAYTATAEGAEDAEQKQRDHQSEINATKEAVIQYATEVLGLPAERVTEFVAMIDQGEADRVEAILNNIARNRFPLFNPTTGGVAKFADGTYNAPGGASVINDGNGPELVTLPNGSKVMTAANSLNYMNQMGGEAAPAQVVQKTVYLTQYITTAAMDPDYAFREAARRQRYAE